MFMRNINWQFSFFALSGFDTKIIPGAKNKLGIFLSYSICGRRDVEFRLWTILHTSVNEKKP